jgi:hypothetical protein
MKDLVICLDIDDCILPSNQTWLGTTDDSLDILKLNMVRIQMILEKAKHLNAKIFIISSWSSILSVENDSLVFEKSHRTHSIHKEEQKVLAVIKQYTDNHIMGISCGNRRTDIKNLLIEGYKVIAIDDMDLSDIRSKKYLFLMVTGFITNAHGYEVKCFIEGTKPKHSDRGKIDKITHIK